MKRPLCICCGALLAALLAADLLPQAAFWAPAAFLVCIGAALYIRGKKTLGRCLCFGGAAAILVFGQTLLIQIWPAERLCGSTVMLTASVEQAEPSYAQELVNAKLRVRRVDGVPQSFTCRCVGLPACETGQEICAKFTISPVEAGRYRLAEYADGVFVMAEYESSFALQKESGGLRAFFAHVQQTLSAHIRRYLSPETGGILAAMTVGDRRFIAPSLQKAYQNAGIPHVLVVSGLHLSLLCQLVPLRRKRGAAAARCFTALANIAIAVLLIGITGASPSVVRAGAAVILCSIGTLLGKPADPLTSLAVVGVILSCSNAYAVCDLAFELSFAATAGVLTASGWLRRKKRRARSKGKSALKTVLPRGGQDALHRAGAALTESLIISGCASLATLPVLILHGMNVSTVSVLTNLATLWLLSPILICGLVCAGCGFFPLLTPILRGAALAGGLLVHLLNTIVRLFAGVPGAHLHAQTAYPVVVLFLLTAFLAAAAWKKLPWRKTLPTAAGLLCFAILLSAGLSRGLVKIAMIGNSRVPCLVVTQQGEADVFFRGGTYNAQKVEEYLLQENISTIRTLVDLRIDPQQACPLAAQKKLLFADIADGDAVCVKAGKVEFWLCRVCSDGGYLLIQGGQYSAATSIGKPDRPEDIYPTELMLATGSAPAGIRPKKILTLTDSYAWLDSAGAQSVYYEQSGAALWIRQGRRGTKWKVRIMGVNGWPIV